MKTIASIVLPIAFFGLTLFLGSCEPTGHTHDSSGHQENAAPLDLHKNASPKDQGPEYTSAYICPEHHQGSGSDKPGKCPVCGTDYVANVEHVKESK